MLWFDTNRSSQPTPTSHTASPPDHSLFAANEPPIAVAGAGLTPNSRNKFVFYSFVPLQISEFFCLSIHAFSISLLDPATTAAGAPRDAEANRI